MKKIHTQIFVLLRLLLISLLIFFIGCQTDSLPSVSSSKSEFAKPTDLKKIAKSEDQISVMSYNVENLFDNLHDKDREDFTYLPSIEKNKQEVVSFCETQHSNSRRKECEETDWNDTVVKTKLANIAKVIRAADAGKGPDNLLLAEVENESILKRLVHDELGDLGYKTIVLIEGPDLRGIDPGFISKFPLSGTPILHLIPYQESDPEQLKWAQRSRGILEVSVILPNNRNLTFLVAHFPSQANPSAWRSQAVQYAKDLMSKYSKLGRAVIFGGDLNIISTEENSKGYFKNELSQVGQVSHLVGCKLCLGSHNYRNEWSFLDVLVYSHNLKDASLELIPESIEIVRTADNMKKNGAPLSFDSDKKNMGVSDHFPLYSRLKILK
ncbi:MAG: endonuclease/exonuclease/phosphatase family protein [Pseudobdellovibrio sp.]